MHFETGNVLNTNENVFASGKGEIAYGEGSHFR